jgi:hypothetical protein
MIDKSFFPLDVFFGGLVNKKTTCLAAGGICITTNNY